MNPFSNVIKPNKPQEPLYKIKNQTNKQKVYHSYQRTSHLLFTKVESKHHLSTKTELNYSRWRLKIHCAKGSFFNEH